MTEERYLRQVEDTAARRVYEPKGYHADPEPGTIAMPSCDKNSLGEALRILQVCDYSGPIERRHLVAFKDFATSMISACQQGTYAAHQTEALKRIADLQDNDAPATHLILKAIGIAKSALLFRDEVG